MSKWKYRLDVKDAWKAAEEGNLEINELASMVANRLKSFKVDDSVLKSLIARFESLAISPSLTESDFDPVWDDLYNWADQGVPPYGEWPRTKMCWVQPS